MADVVVAVEAPSSAASRVLKATLTAVVVAEARLETVMGVVVAPDKVEVAKTVPKVGEVVAVKVKV